VGVPGHPGGGEHHPLSRAQMDGALLELPDADFGTLQIQQDPHKDVLLPFHFTNPVNPAAGLLVASMRQVQAEQVDAGGDQLTDGGVPPGGGSKGGHDFGEPRDHHISPG